MTNLAYLYLEDKSGLFRIDQLTSVTPAEQREERRDQSKVTAVHAVLHTVGGAVHHTALPYAETVATVKAGWSGSSDSSSQSTAPQS